MSRLHQVLSVGMNGADARYFQHGAEARFGTTITDENDPLFLLFARQGLMNEILHHQDPPPPDDHSMGQFAYHEWQDTVDRLKAKRAHFESELSQVETKLKAHMSRELYTKYLMMVTP
jgi:hypothetical protein